jgi:hypothetical protein
MVSPGSLAIVCPHSGLLSECPLPALSARQVRFTSINGFAIVISLIYLIINIRENTTQLGEGQKDLQ